MFIEITDYCPVQQKNVTVRIDYLTPTRLTKDGVVHLVKDHVDCEYIHNGGDCCSTKCPIWQKAVHTRPIDDF